MSLSAAARGVADGQATDEPSTLQPSPTESVTADSSSVAASSSASASTTENTTGGSSESTRKTDDESGGDVPTTGVQPELSAEDEEVVAELQRRDQEVRAHEQAHASAGGRYAGQPQYEYQVGPDGERYAVGGSVPIDVSEVPDDPRATVEKMQTVRRAANAPAEPSGQDRRVAAQAAQKLAAAQAELREASAAESSDASEEDSSVAAEAGGTESTERNVQVEGAAAEQTSESAELDTPAEPSSQVSTREQARHRLASSRMQRAYQAAGYAL